MPCPDSPLPPAGCWGLGQTRVEGRPRVLAGPSRAASHPKQRLQARTIFLCCRAEGQEHRQVAGGVVPASGRCPCLPLGSRGGLGRPRSPIPWLGAPQCGRPLLHVSLQQVAVGSGGRVLRAETEALRKPLLSAPWLRSPWPKRITGSSSESLWQWQQGTSILGGTVPWQPPKGQASMSRSHSSHRQRTPLGCGGRLWAAQGPRQGEPRWP